MIDYYIIMRIQQQRNDFKQQYQDRSKRYEFHSNNMINFSIQTTSQDRKKKRRNEIRMIKTQNK